MKIEEIHERLSGVNAITKPSHYTHGKIEVIDAIEDWGLDDSQCLSNVIKYVARHRHKKKPVEDLKKAHAYLTREINKMHGITGDRWEKHWD